MINNGEQPSHPFPISTICLIARLSYFKPHSDLTNSKTRRKKLTEITTGRQKIKYNNQSERRNRIIRIILLLREEDFISSEKNEAKKEGMLSGTTLHLAKY